MRPPQDECVKISIQNNRTLIYTINRINSVLMKKIDKIYLQGYAPKITRIGRDIGKNCIIHKYLLQAIGYNRNYTLEKIIKERHVED